MARDMRKNTAFSSGMRGQEKPKISEGNVRGDAATSQPGGSKGGESMQGPHTKVGDPGGVDLSAYSSGMRGAEKPKQKSAEAATMSTGNSGGSGSEMQGVNTSVGNPKGEDTSRRMGPSMGNDAAQQRVAGAEKLGIPGNNTEAATSQDAPMVEEDDTHLHIKVPKAAVKRRSPTGM